MSKDDLLSLLLFLTRADISGLSVFARLLTDLRRRKVISHEQGSAKKKELPPLLEPPCPLPSDVFE